MFSQRTLDFLYFVNKENSKQWYQDHKDDYKTYVTDPMKNMILEMAPTMNQIDPMLLTDPKQIMSRIFRDMRFNPEGLLYRDHIWFTFMREKKVFNGFPGFFFEISPYKVTWGCGFYQASAAAMKIYRDMIVENNPLFQSAIEAFEKQNIFVLEGDDFKTNKYDNYPENIQKWLNKKTVCLIAYSNDIDLFLSDKLPAYIAKSFMDVKPIYDFFIAAENLSLS